MQQNPPSKIVFKVVKIFLAITQPEMLNKHVLKTLPPAPTSAN
jgi:hypothetical protein